MVIGVIVAMDKELGLLLPLMGGEGAVEVTSIDGVDYHCGHIGSKKVVAVKCGVGKVNAAIGAMTLIDHFKPSLVLNTGVAGGTGHGAGILDVVVGTRIAYHDVWCGPGTEWGEAWGCPRFFATSERVNSLECLRPSATLKHGLICSGDVFVSSVEIVERIRSLYPDVDAVDMESGAIAQVCHMRGVEMACVRVVSDTPGAADNIAQYESFWDDAPRRTFEVLSHVIAELGDDDNA